MLMVPPYQIPEKKSITVATCGGICYNGIVKLQITSYKLQIGTA
jgi:hypothetical protein